MAEIRIAAFDPREPRKAWVVEGLECATYPGWAGALNGYVRLPDGHPDLLLAEVAEMMPGTPFTFDGKDLINYNRGYDYVDVDVPGGWTYGPDAQGWIGFDTGHYCDKWSPEDRLRLCVDDQSRVQADLMITMDREFPPMEWDVLWTEEKLVAAVEEAARVLAMHARITFKDRR